MSDQDRDPNDTPESPTSSPAPQQPERTGSRRLSRKGMTRSRKRDLDSHAAVEAERKAARRLSRTPSRDDVARAALHGVLRILHDRPEFEEAQQLRRYAIRLLRRALFDEAEAERVVADMIVRATHDREEWLYGRAYRAWRAGGCQGPRPERPPLPKHAVQEIPRREDGTLPWRGTTPRPPGSRRPTPPAGDAV